MPAPSPPFFRGCPSREQSPPGLAQAPHRIRTGLLRHDGPAAPAAPQAKSRGGRGPSRVPPAVLEAAPPTRPRQGWSWVRMAACLLSHPFPARGPVWDKTLTFCISRHHRQRCKTLGGTRAPPGPHPTLTCKLPARSPGSGGAGHPLALRTEPQPGWWGAANGGAAPSPAVSWWPQGWAVAGGPRPRRTPSVSPAASCASATASASVRPSQRGWGLLTHLPTAPPRRALRGAALQTRARQQTKATLRCGAAVSTKSGRPPALLPRAGRDSSQGLGVLEGRGRGPRDFWGEQWG